MCTLIGLENFAPTCEHLLQKVFWACWPRHWMKSPHAKSQTQRSWGVAETLHFRILERSSSLKSQALRTFGRLAHTAHMLCCNRHLTNIILLRFSMSSHRHTHVHSCMQIRGAQYGVTCSTLPRLTNKHTEAPLHVR